MKVLLTGASGFIGRYVLQVLHQHDIECVALCRQLPAFDSPWIKLDLLHATSAQLRSLLVIHAPTHLIHLAWYTEHEKYWTSPLNWSWVQASLRLAEVFIELGGQRIIGCGTCAEYDWNDGYLCESKTPLLPKQVYGSAKLSTYRLLCELCEKKRIELIWGRIFLLYGPGENRQRLIPALIDALQGRRHPFSIDVSAWRDFMHVEDLARALVELLNADLKGPLNLCSGIPVQVGQILNQLAADLRANPQPVLMCARKKRCEPSSLVGDASRLYATGWRPQSRPFFYHSG